MSADQSGELSRLWEHLLVAATSRERARSASLDVRASVVQSVESALDPLGIGSTADRLTRLWNRFDELTTRPADQSLRELILGDAEALTAVVRRDAAAVHQAWEQELAHLRRRVARVNRLLDERQTGSTRRSAQQLDVDLAGLIAVDLSESADARTLLCFEHPSVLEGAPLSVRAPESVNAGWIDQGDPQIRIRRSSGDELVVIGGAAHGSLVLLNETLPTLASWLARLTRVIVESTNRLHQSGVGLDNSTDVPFFEPEGLTPQTFHVAVEIAGRGQRLAAGAPAQTGRHTAIRATLDASTAMAMARLGTQIDGPWAVLMQGIVDLGVLVADLNSRADAARVAFRRVERTRQDGSTTTLNRKLAGLLTTQEALDAAARMDATISGVLDTIEFGTGLDPA